MDKKSKEHKENDSYEINKGLLIFCGALLILIIALVIVVLTVF